MTNMMNSPPVTSYPCLSILRLASPPESHHQTAVTRLRQALLDHFHASKDAASAKEEQTTTTTTLSNETIETVTEDTTTNTRYPHHLHLSNRYFSAQVALYDVDVDSNNDNKDNHYSILSNQDEDELLQPPQPWKEDGIVLVIGEQEEKIHQGDHHHHSSSSSSSTTDFETVLEPLHQRAVANDCAGDLLRLCIVVTNTTQTKEEDDYNYDDNADGNSNSPAEQQPDHDFSQRVLWCLDRGYEYVGQVDLSAHGCRQGHDERDKSGFARIVEAIRGTVWSSAVMQTSKQQELQSSYQQDKEALLSNTKEKNGTRRDQDETITENDSLYLPPSCIPLVDGASPLQPLTLTPEQVQAQQEREEQARTAIWEQSNLQNSGDEHHVDGVPHLASAESTSQQHRQHHSQNDERYFDQLEYALLQAKQIRQLSQSGQLSDEDRRQRAGDAAMLLMNLMNYNGGEEEEDDDDGSGEDDDDKGGCPSNEKEQPSPVEGEEATSSANPVGGR